MSSINDYSLSLFQFIVICALGFVADVPEYRFEEKYHRFSFKSLLTMPEILTALAKVKSECNKVAGMSLFQIPITKSMRLEEFEQAQGQASSHVS